MAKAKKVVDDKAMNLGSLVSQFGGEDKCREYLDGLRWPDGRVCIRCGMTKGISYVSTREQYECESCGYHFSVTAGTVLHDTHLPLWKWLMATFIICESKKGVSAKQIQRMLGVSYKTAWHLCHRIRHAMGQGYEGKLFGVVEMDETVVGGKIDNRGRGQRFKGDRDANKTMVVGAIQRGGQIRLRVTKGADRTNLKRFIADNIAGYAKAIYTDQWAAYRGVGDADTEHASVNHKANEWVRGDVHTQGIENVWSLFKRSIVGSYHHLSAKHLPAYLDEMEWRFNNRKNEYLFRDTVMALLKSESLPLKRLVDRAA